MNTVYNYNPVPAGAPPRHGSNTQHTPPKSIRGKYKKIFGYCLILTLPLLIIVGILLGLVFHYRVRHNIIGDGSLQSDGTQDEDGIIYANINVTYLMKVASISSTIATSLAAFAVVLAAYPLASKILRHTQFEESGELPTPYQYYLGVGLIESAGLSTMYRWVDYVRGKKSRGVSQPGSLKNVAWTAVVCSLLGGIVYAAETWFHFGTEPYNFSQVYPGIASYSNFLNSNCTSTSNTYKDQEKNACSIRPDIRGGTLINPIISLEVLDKVSTNMSVNVFTKTTPPRAFLGIPQNGALLKHDYTAFTYSASTQCTPIIKECGLSRNSLTNGVSIPFTCQKYPAIYGNLLGQNTFSIRYFTNSSGTSNSTTEAPVTSNPFFFGVNGNTLRASGAGITFKDDPEVISLEFGGLAFVFYCNTTVYDTTYTAINGSIASMVSQPSNTSITTMMRVVQTETRAADIKLQDAANLAALGPSVQAMADTFALQYSISLLSLVAGALVPSPTMELQQRSEMIVARIPTSALYLLVASILLLVIFGIFLTIVALGAAVSTKDIEEVTARMSLQGLVAERLESERAGSAVGDLDEMFEEKAGVGCKRVGLGRCESGGWGLKVWQSAGNRNK